MFIVELGSENNQEMEIEVLFPGDFLMAWPKLYWKGRGGVWGKRGIFGAWNERLKRCSRA